MSPLSIVRSLLRHHPAVRPVSTPRALAATSPARSPFSTTRVALQEAPNRWSESGLQPPSSTSQTASSPLDPPNQLNEKERAIFLKVRDTLAPVQLEVHDISGGCGSMYAINIVSPTFKGLSVVQQHRMVTKVLKDEIAQWHGIQLSTRTPHGIDK